ncbi:MAG: nuclear transport factor 2 family protein [Intrasporangiaceae bacterium]|nr:nuclear transport factor 2 family protein [Intrasporangiaceae bacterium]
MRSLKVPGMGIGGAGSWHGERGRPELLRSAHNTKGKILILEPNAADVIRAHVAAFNSADASQVASGFHVDAKFCTGRDVVVEGRQSLKAFFEEAFRALSLKLTVEVLVVDDQRVAAQLQEHVVDDGVESVDHIAAFYDVEGGLLRSVKVYREGSATE